MLTTEQIDRFHRDGLLVVRGVFDDDEVRALQAAADEVTREAVAGAGAGHGYREVDGRKQYYRTDGVLWDGYAAFRTATVNPGLLAAVGQCLGYPFLPINDSLVVKLPHSGVAIPWHQDPPYQGADGRAETFGIPNFDCDIYLDSATLRERMLVRPGRLPPLWPRRGGTLRRGGAVRPGRRDPARDGSRRRDPSRHQRATWFASQRFEHTPARVLRPLQAREVLETLHPDWVGTKVGFDERGLRARPGDGR